MNLSFTTTSMSSSSWMKRLMLLLATTRILSVSMFDTVNAFVVPVNRHHDIRSPSLSCHQHQQHLLQRRQIVCKRSTSSIINDSCLFSTSSSWTRRAWLQKQQQHGIVALTAASGNVDNSNNFFDLPSQNNGNYKDSNKDYDTVIDYNVKTRQQSLRRVLQLNDDDNGNDTRGLSSSSSSSTKKFPSVIGHRGCLYDALENTREGFNKCIDMGCDGVELDVFALRCGTLIVFHGSGTDANPGLLNEYFNCNFQQQQHKSNSILDYTYQDILHGNWKFNIHNDEFPCPIESIERGTIPTLEQVLMDVKQSNSNMHVTMELKGGQQLPERVLQLVDDLDMVHQTSCSSFNMDYLKQVRTLRPQQDNNGQYIYKTGALFDDVYDSNGLLSKAHSVGANEIHLRYDTCTKQLIETIHREGFGSMAWFRGPVGMGYDTKHKYLDVGNEDESMYHVVSQTGVQKLCVNRPKVLLGMRERLLAGTTSVVA